jgi:hypothetical protein
LVKARASWLSLTIERPPPYDVLISLLPHSKEAHNLPIADATSHLALMMPRKD